MKNRRIINFLAAFILVFAAVPGLIQPVQGSGGPDNGGYIYEDSSDPGGPAYAWEEISTTGTKVTLANNAMSGAIALPFSFQFYGTVYNQFYISSNGFLTFLDKQPDSKTAAAVPTAATPNAIIAGYWADLNPAGSGASITYQTMGTAPNRRMIVEFNAVPHNGLTSSAAVTFQVKLYETLNNIEVHYNTTATDGSTHTAGIENAAGSIGLQYYSGAEDLPGSLAVRYSLFTGVALRPTYEIKYGEPGTSLTYTQRIANWTGAATTFTLTPTGSTWPTSITMNGKDFTTTAMENGEAQEFTVKVDIPADADPGDYSQVGLHVAQNTGGSYEDATTLVTAVPRRGYGMGYFDANGDSAPGIVQIDTKFHNSLHEPVNLDSLGQYTHYGTISPDGKQLWVVDSGSANSAFVINLDKLNGPYISIPAGNETSDVAFTPNGKTALISSYGAGNVEIVDTSTYTVLKTLTTGTNSLKTTIGACFPRKGYVTNLGSNSVSVVNLLTNTVTNITGFNKPHGVVISPKTNRAYVSNNGAASIMVIDTETDKISATWSVSGGDAMAGIGITPDGERLYVASNSTVKVLDANSGALITTIASPMDKLWDLAVFPDGKGTYAYVTSSNLNYSSILVIDTSTNQVVKEIQDAWGIMGIALFPDPTECNVAPVASFTPSNAIAHVGEPFKWTNTTTYGATSYTWNFGDNSPESSEEHPTHTYTTAGTYVVTLTATNSHGTSKATGLVHFAPVAKFTPQNSLIKLGDSITFQNDSTGSADLHYSWDFGDGTTTSSEKDPTHTYAAINDYTVTLTVTNDYGTATASGKVDFPPAASFTPQESTISPGESVAFTNTSTGTDITASPLTYTWDFGDGLTSTEKSPTHTYEGKADATVKLTAHNGFGQDSTAEGKVYFKPKAQFTPTNTVILAGGTVNFTDQSIGPGPFTYAWDFGDNTTSDVQNPQHTFAAEGEFPITLTVTNSNGSDTATGKVIVSTKPVADFTQSASVININDTVTFTNKTVGAEPVTYSWDFGDGSAKSTETNPQHTYTKAGNFTITLTATNPAGSGTKTSEIRFFVKAAFDPVNATIQTGDSLSFNNLSTGSTPMSYTWDFGDGSEKSTDPSPTHQYTAAGTYTVTLTAHNEYGPDSTATGTVVFKPKAAFTPLESVIVVGGSVTFTNQTTGTGTITYSWDFGDGSAKSTEVNPTHQYTKAGAFTVTLTATSAAYGSHSATGTVLFAPTAGFTPKDSIIQTGDSITFTNSTVGTNTTNHPMAYVWDFGDGTAASTTASPTHQYTTAGTYTVKLTAHNGLGTDSTVTGTVNFKPKAAFTPLNSVIHVGESVTFTNATTGTGEITYSWDFGDGTAKSTVASPTHQYTKAGLFTVTLTATHATYGSHSITGTVAFAPTAGFNPKDSIIQTGDSVTFTNTSVGTNTTSNPLTYVWDFGDGTATSTTASPTHQYTTAGTYTVKLTAHNGLGTDSTVTGTVNFKPKAAFTPLNNVIHVGESVTFTNKSTGTGNLTYSWDFGDKTAKSTDASPTHQYTAAGVYTVTLTATSATYGSHSTTGTVVFAPTAGFGPKDSIIQTGDSITFTNTSVGTNTTSNPMTYTWDFGDSTAKSTEANPTHQYSTAGTYTVKLTAHNGLGTDSTVTGTVVFKPRAAFTELNSVIHLGDSVTFTNMTTGTEGLSYIWDFGDGTAKSTEVSPTHQYMAAGIYEVKLTATNDYGTDIITGQVAFSPVAAFTPEGAEGKPIIIKLGDPIQFTNKSTGTDLMTFTWDFGDGTTPVSEANPSHTYQKAGTYTIKLTATNAYGSHSVTGTVVFSPKAGFSPQTHVIRLGEDLHITNLSTGTAPLTYSWDFGDGSPASSDVTPSHMYGKVGDYTIRLKVTNAYGTEEFTGKIVFAPVASFTASSQSVKLNQPVKFTSAISGTPNLTVTWDFGDGSAASHDLNPTHAFGKAGKFTVKLTVTNAYGSAVYTMDINAQEHQIYLTMTLQ